jgi:AbrB family looped-hinge helix DNA binding protein
MASAKISSKFQVVIPKEVRDELHWPAGSQVIVFPFEDRLEIFLEKDIRKMRGALKPMNTDIERESEDRI